jgi:hypothetical protein
MILQISASQEARNIAVSQWFPLQTYRAFFCLFVFKSSSLLGIYIVKSLVISLYTLLNIWLSEVSLDTYQHTRPLGFLLPCDLPIIHSKNEQSLLTAPAEWGWTKRPLSCQHQTRLQTKRAVILYHRSNISDYSSTIWTDFKWEPVKTFCLQ